MRRRIFNRAAGGMILAGLLAGGAARADEAGLAAGHEREVDEALRFLGRLDRPDALEPAGSHGSLGLGVGAGGTSYAAPADNAVLKAQLGSGPETGSYSLPRAWLVKGLPWPVDLGLTAGAPAGGAFSQVSGHVQWTVYEALAMPAVALRASYGRLLGAGGTAVASTGGEAVASYGFLRYFTVFASAGVTRHEGTLAISGSGDLAYLLADGQGRTEVTRAWTEPVRAAGLRVMVVPPFVGVTAQVEQAADGRRDVAAKLSVGM